jgi:hypothetical protein
MATNYSFSRPPLSAQEPGAHGTSYIINDAARGRSKPRLLPPRPQSPVQFVMHGPDFSEVNAFIGAVQSSDPGVAGSLLVFGTSASARALGTGQAARGRR